MWSDMTLGTSFKVKQGYPTLKVLISRFLLVPEVCDVKPTYRKIIGWESFDLARFDLGPFLRGQTRIAKSKSAYKSLFLS